MKIHECKAHGADQSIVDILAAAGITQFTKAQEEAFKSGLCNNVNLLVSSPTSSGKTTIAEVAAVHGALEGVRSVYLVTHRALAEEKYNLFKERYDSIGNNWFEVSIATGDRVEGDWANGILVSTYEKYLALLSTSSLNFADGKVIVADEIQILGDASRGAGIEVLCTIIKRSNPKQFIGLSATLPNAREIADWLGLTLVDVPTRDVRLRQEYWYQGRCGYCYYGDDEIIEDEENKITDGSTLGAAYKLLGAGLGPILVFAMTRRKARELASQFSSSRPKEATSYTLSEQLELFSEPSTNGNILKDASERKVAFHSTDLSFDERKVVEEALKKRELDVVFSTPTLAAGVNFPIRTVLFDSFSRFWMEPSWLPKSEYLNMSGRAGRLGMDEEGLSILIAQNQVEKKKAEYYLSPDMEPLESKLLARSLRLAILQLVACGICKTEPEINSFFSDSFWWHQALEHNPAQIENVTRLIRTAIEWHLENELIIQNAPLLLPTLLGAAIATTGLLPETGTNILALIDENSPQFDDNSYILPLIHAVCASEEFKDSIGQRYLPYSYQNQPEFVALQAIGSAGCFINPNMVVHSDRVINAAYGLFLWIQGLTERDLLDQLPPISYGQMHSLAGDVSWVMDGLGTIIRVYKSGIYSALSTKIKILAERIKHGVPEELLDILKPAIKFDVPGLGRQRGMAILKAGFADPNELVKTKKENLASAVGSEARAVALIEAVSKYFDLMQEHWETRHSRIASEISLDPDEIRKTYAALGTAYEDAVQTMLLDLGFDVKQIDDGKRQGVPDLLVLYDGKSALIECKTKNRASATISTSDAFAILTKGADIRSDYYVTIGKPEFNYHSKNKAAASNAITLVPHHAFVEAYLSVKKGEISLDTFFKWLVGPGVAGEDSLNSLKLEDVHRRATP